MPPVASRDWAGDASNDKLTQLLSEAASGHPEGLVALAGHLVEKQEFTFVAQCLKDLDATLIPGDVKGTGVLGATALMEATGRASLSLSSLIAVLRALNHAAQTPAAKAFQGRCLAMLTEHWVDVTTWIAHFLKNPMASPQGPATWYYLCTMLLGAVVSRADGDLYKEEIISHRNTLHLTFLLLCDKKGRSGGFYLLPASTGEACRILLFVKAILDSQVGLRAAQRRLGHSRGDYRAAQIATCFVERAQHLVRDGTSNVAAVAGSAKSLVCLISSVAKLVTDPKLWRDFARKGVMFSYAAVLRTLCDVAQRKGVSSLQFWSDITQGVETLINAVVESAPNPPSSTKTLVKGGILSCAAACSTTEAGIVAQGVIESLSAMVPFLYLSGVAGGAERRADFQRFQSVLEETLGRFHGRVVDLVKEFQLCIVLCHRTHTDRKDRYVAICNNISHDPLTGNCEISAIKTCSRCHSVVYCSTDCQAKDWEGMHSRECKNLSVRYKERKANRSWISTQTRIDQLRLLDTYMNSACPSPSELKSHKLDGRETPPIGPSRSPNSSLAILDYHVSQSRLVFTPSYPLEIYLNEMRTLQSATVWVPRVKGHAEEVEKKAETILLIEGLFKFNSTTSMKTFARMRYSLDAMEGEKYTVLSSFFQIS